MGTGDKDVSESLSYASNNHPAREPWHKRWGKSAIVILLICTINLALFLMGIVDLVAAAILGIFLFAIATAVVNSRKNPSREFSEDEMEAQWKQKLLKRQEHLDVARQIYGLLPAGKWHRREYSFSTLGRHLIEECTLELTPDGKGIFQMIRMKDDPGTVTKFECKPEGEGKLRIEVLAPRLESSQVITFDLDITYDADVEILVLSFQSKNPYPPDFVGYWPFDKSYQREMY